MANRKIGAHELTDQMESFIDDVLFGTDIKGLAYAGAGKSTLLRAVEKYHSGRGLYICRDKSLEMEARELFQGANVDIYTSHAFALNSLDKDIKFGFMFLKNNEGEFINKQSRFNPIRLKDVLDNIKVDESFSDAFDLRRNYKKILSCVEQYFYSASVELSMLHLSKAAGDHVDSLFKKKKITTVQIKAYKELVIDCAKQIAKLMLNPKSNFPSSHDAYVKYWQLSNPKLDYDYIMVDEVQDSSSVLLSVILKQECQRIYVGDKYQSINQYRGGINAMDIIPCKSQALSNAFRYGQKIADLATKILRHDNPEIQITGLGFDTEVIKGSEYNESNSILYIANSNAALQEIILESYLAGIPAKFVTNKALYSANNLESLINIAINGEPTLAAHKEYTNLEHVLLNPRTSENRIFAELIRDDLPRARSMLAALRWSSNVGDDAAKITVTTAHGCKGLEYDHVMLSDDFYSAINAFGGGKPIQDSELYLLYVAVTRPRKTLILPDELYNALERNLAFKINKTPIPEYLTDNLVPVSARAESPSKTPAKEKPKTEAKPKTKSEKETDKSDNKTAPSKKPESSKEIARTKPDDDAKEKSSSSGKQSSSTDKKPESSVEKKKEPEAPKGKKDFIDIEIGKKRGLQFVVDEDDDNKTEKWLPAAFDSSAHMSWQPTNSAKFFNQNIGIVGTMGTGKTQTVKSMLTQINRQRDLNTDGESIGILIFDYKDDYVDDKFIEATGAKVLEADRIPINPFALFDNHRLAPVRTASTFVTTLSKVYKLGPKQEQNLKNCISLAYEKKGIDKAIPESYEYAPPTLRDVVAIYNSQDKIPMDSLTSALSNLYENEVFETESRKCKGLFEFLEGNTVVVRLSGIDSELQSLIVAVILDMFYTQMHQSGKPSPKGDFRALKKLILVDEADTFLSKDFPSLRKILKEAREFGCGCMLSTQGLDHFQTANNSYSDYICSWIVHRLENPTVNQVKSTFNTENKDEISKTREQVRSLAKHHSFFIDGDKVQTHMESTAFWKIV